MPIWPSRISIRIKAQITYTGWSALRCGSGCSREDADITGASGHGHRAHSRGLPLRACRGHC
eukprot:31179_3